MTDTPVRWRDKDSARAAFETDTLVGWVRPRNRGPGYRVASWPRGRPDASPTFSFQDFAADVEAALAAHLLQLEQAAGDGGG